MVAVAGTLAAATLLVSTGCSREKYYRQADDEVACLVAEKSNDPRWCAPPDFNVAMDSRSRFYDPCDEIRPPMPEDDPASHEFMHCVDGKKGWRYWHRNGERAGLENPDWRARIGDYAPVRDDGAVNLSLSSALDIARINSPDYQSQWETVYLSALDVSAERFRFETQFFGGVNAGGAIAGSQTPGGSSSTAQAGYDMQLRRRFATAGELLVGFANSMVWQFAGPDQYANISILNFNLVQPLLRTSGRDFALETLTISERTLLGNLRAMQRYRQGFFTRVAIGDAGVSGPQRRGGFLGDSGLTGFTGTGSGGLGGIGTATGFGRAGFSVTAGGGAGGGIGYAGGGAGQVGGFIGLLQQEQQIRNNESSLGLQLRTLGLLEAHLEAGTIDLAQVDQFRQSIQTANATLLQSRNDLETALDTFRTATLGMPPDLPVALDGSLIGQFRFTDPAITNLQKQLTAFQSELGVRPKSPTVASVASGIEKLESLCRQIAEQFPAVARDVQNASDRAPARTAGMSAAERDQFAADLRQLDKDRAALQQRLATAAAALAELRKQLTEANCQTTADRLIQQFTDASTILDSLSLVQSRARLEQIAVEHQRLDPHQALEIARSNRLDWMNNRASLVDTWRLIQYNANRLQSDLSVNLSGDISTTGNSPMRFRAPTGNLRASVQFDGPFTRLLERNNFRQVIIDYQRDRRQLIQFEDSVHQSIRQQLRDLEELQTNLEIQRRAVVIAIRRVDQTREGLSQPPPAPQPGQPVTPLGPTAALNLLTALNDLQSSLNNFMSVWLNDYAARMRLARELGVMELDERGMWIDKPVFEPEQPADTRSADAAEIPPDVPGALIRALTEARTQASADDTAKVPAEDMGKAPAADSRQPANASASTPQKLPAVKASPVRTSPEARNAPEERPPTESAPATPDAAKPQVAEVPPQPPSTRWTLDRPAAVVPVAATVDPPPTPPPASPPTIPPSPPPSWLPSPGGMQRMVGRPGLP